MTQNGSAVVANGKSSPVKRDELKIVIVGDGGCGKTSLLMVYAKGDFPEVMRTQRHTHSSQYSLTVITMWKAVIT